MAPVRRYLRVSRHTVLEVRIHVDNPADTARWLLHPRTPALPRVLAAVRPLLVPKLREENERVRRGRTKAKKSQPVKDVVAGDDFEVTVLFVEGGTPHSVLKRHKTFDAAKKQQQKADALDSGTQNAPVDVDDADDNGAEPAAVLVREESDDDGDTGNAGVKLEDIPAHDQANDARMQDAVGGATANSPAAVSSEDSDAERNKEAQPTDDKKKMGMTATYEGFRIHGYTLYLVVKRIDAGPGAADGAAPGHSLMEGWIASTQTAPPVADD